jgi:hypothetical protein
MEMQDPTHAGLSVIFVFADSEREWNVSQWRSLTVSDALNRAGGNWQGKCLHFSGFSNYMDDSILDWVMSSDLIIFSRNALLPQSHDAIKYFQIQGKPVVMDLDDAYFMLPHSNPARRFWFEAGFQTYDGPEKAGASRMLEHALWLSDGLIAPNRMLLDMYKPLSGNGYYLQNYAEGKWWQELPERNNDGKIVIGWGGSLSHLDSWLGSGLMKAVERISARHRNVYWKICGGDDNIFKALPTTQKIRQPGVPPNVWPTIVRTFDIGVAPLWGIYDQYRSWIKGIEYALAGVPWVGSAGPTYNDLAGWGTLVPEFDAEAWEASLEDMIDKLETFQAEAEARRAEAQQAFLIDNNIHVYEAVYNQILADFKDNKEDLPGVVYLERDDTRAKLESA